MTEHAKGNARGWLQTMREMIAALEAGKEYEGQAADQAIQESPLSVEIRSEWKALGSPWTPGQYTILLTTGGPALRIIGELDEYREPDSYPRLEWQDWGTPWTDCDWLTETDRQALATYARQFYYGEG